MPTYDYERVDGSRFELVQKMSEDKLTVCPTTGQECKRLISKRKVPLGFTGLTRGTKVTEWY